MLRRFSGFVIIVQKNNLTRIFILPENVKEILIKERKNYYENILYSIEDVIKLC